MKNTTYPGCPHCKHLDLAWWEQIPGDQPAGTTFDHTCPACGTVYEVVMYVTPEFTSRTKGAKNAAST